MPVVKLKIKWGMEESKTPSITILCIRTELFGATFPVLVPSMGVKLTNTKVLTKGLFGNIPGTGRTMLLTIAGVV